MHLLVERNNKRQAVGGGKKCMLAKGKSRDNLKDACVIGHQLGVLSKRANAQNG